MSGFIYIAYDHSGLFKIGTTDNPKKRLAQFRIGNPHLNFYKVFQIESALVVEAEIHSAFQNKRKKGEWFFLSPSDLKWIISKYENPLVKKKTDSAIAIDWAEMATDKILKEPDSWENEDYI